MFDIGLKLNTQHLLGSIYYWIHSVGKSLRIITGWPCMAATCAAFAK